MWTSVALHFIHFNWWSLWTSVDQCSPTLHSFTCGLCAHFKPYNSFISLESNWLCTCIHVFLQCQQHWEGWLPHPHRTHGSRFSEVMRLRSGHNRLNAQMYRKTKLAKSTCNRGLANQMVAWASTAEMPALRIARQNVWPAVVVRVYSYTSSINSQISILLLCFLYLFVELMITMNE